MAVSAADSLAVSAHGPEALTSTGTTPGAKGLHELLLDGQTASANVLNVLSDATLEETMEGESTFTLTLFDPDYKLVNSKLFDHAVDLDIDGLEFRLSALDASAWPQLKLVFSDRAVVRLKDKKGSKKASRKRMTRAEFILSLVREVRTERIPFYAPELHKRQPVTKLTHKDEDTLNQRSKITKFGTDSGVTVKGNTATRAQLRVIEAVLQQGADQGATERELIGAVMCITQESSASNLPGGDRDSRGAFQQRPSAGWPASRNVRKDAEAFFSSFLQVVKKYGLSQTLGWEVDQVQRSFTFGGSRQGSTYDQWKSEATDTVKAWLGTGGVSGSETRVKAYEFHRGEAGNRDESSWDAIQRLATEVKWRAFVRRGVLYYLSETTLLGRRAVLRLSPSSQGVQSMPFSYDRGKPVQQVTANILADFWTALPGDHITVKDLGRASGEYLVASVTRSYFSPVVEVTLKAPTKPLPEPAPSTVTVTTGTTRFDGPLGNAGVDGHPELKHKISRIVNTVLKEWPHLTITSTTSGNHVNGSYHYKGMAVDLGGTQSYMDKAAKWIADNLTDYLSEGIHNPGLAVKDMKTVSGPGVYSEVWAGHKDHIHLAVDESVTWARTPPTRGSQPDAQVPLEGPTPSPFGPLIVPQFK